MRAIGAAAVPSETQGAHARAVLGTRYLRILSPAAIEHLGACLMIAFFLALALFGAVSQ